MCHWRLTQKLQSHTLPRFNYFFKWLTSIHQLHRNAAFANERNDKGRMYLHCVPRKRLPFYFWNNSVKNKTISIIFGAQTPEETRH